MTWSNMLFLEHDLHSALFGAVLGGVIACAIFFQLLKYRRKE